MAIVRPDDWRPRGVDDLEPNAWTALRREASTCVVAGPGAGKTEFLAQRAAYLLETGLCSAPRRVLAISLKADAADNLAKRVRERCGAAVAGRFASMTFDAFTKGLVDRFLPAIPEAWRPNGGYEVLRTREPMLAAFLAEALRAAPRHWQAGVAGFGATDFETRVVGALRLPAGGIEVADPATFAVERWWAQNLRAPTGSRLSFTMINRLAELLLRSRPELRRALRATYPFVFVDEFQDTTFAHYDLLISAIRHPGAVVTAVGDDKQRIMGWAGARKDSFARFRADFEAERIPLIVNFRSSPGLLRTQHVVARALDPGAAVPEPRTEGLIDGDVAQVWSFDSLAAEAAHAAAWLADDMARRGTRPRDYAILVRQTAEAFEAQLGDPFAAAGIGVRNESRVLGETTLQDLLFDEFALVAVALLRLAMARRAPDAWDLACRAVHRLRAADPDDEGACARAEAGLSAFVRDLRRWAAATPPGEAAAAEAAGRIMRFVDPAALAQAYEQYGRGETLRIMTAAFEAHLAASVEGCADWVMAIDRFEGRDRIPLMTVHKVKGLEFDTVLFMGLDDRMWWSHVPGNDEGIATFFVALSRAKQRAVFTFCHARGRRHGVRDLFALLTEAGVPEIAP